MKICNNINGFIEVVCSGRKPDLCLLNTLLAHLPQLKSFKDVILSSYNKKHAI